ncbi:MAG: DUF4363 family protein [Clostridiales bacterium]|nr:DUF4363 family protein [Clostridiales bacterium]
MGTNIYVNKSMDSLLNTLNSDGDGIYSLWEREKRILSVFLKHEDIDDLDMEIKNMKSYGEAGNDAEQEKCKVKARSIIKSIAEGEKLTWGNIF